MKNGQELKCIGISYSKKPVLLYKFVFTDTTNEQIVINNVSQNDMSNENFRVFKIQETQTQGGRKSKRRKSKKGKKRHSRKLK